MTSMSKGRIRPWMIKGRAKTALQYKSTNPCHDVLWNVNSNFDT